MKGFDRIRDPYDRYACINKKAIAFRETGWLLCTVQLKGNRFSEEDELPRDQGRQDQGEQETPEVHRSEADAASETDDGAEGDRKEFKAEAGKKERIALEDPHDDERELIEDHDRVIGEERHRDARGEHKAATYKPEHLHGRVGGHIVGEDDEVPEVDRRGDDCDRYDCDEIPRIPMVEHEDHHDGPVHHEARRADGDSGHDAEVGREGIEGDRAEAASKHHDDTERGREEPYEI